MAGRATAGVKLFPDAKLNLAKAVGKMAKSEEKAQLKRKRENLFERVTREVLTNKPIKDTSLDAAGSLLIAQSANGLKVARSIWNKYQSIEAPCYWTITRIKFGSDLRHGKAWGIFTWRGAFLLPALRSVLLSMPTLLMFVCMQRVGHFSGRTDPKPSQITSVLKKQWKIFNPEKIMFQKQQAANSTKQFVTNTAENHTSP